MKKKTVLKNKIILGGVIIAAILITTWLAGSLFSQKQRSETTTPKVAATIFPLYDIARHVAGDAAEVTLLLPSGASPHTFEPTPTTLKNLHAAAVLYTIGYGMDDWAIALAEGGQTNVITLTAGINLYHSEGDQIITAEASERESEPDHEHGDTDPHYWLSVPNAAIIATNIATDLMTRWPNLAPVIETNLIAYLDELAKADTQIREILSRIQKREIVTLHAAWYYFAEEYDLTVAASFEPSPGKEPTPQYLASLGHAVDQTDVGIVYSEPQISTATLEPFVQDHGLKIAILDPLGGFNNRDSYIALMLYNAQTIAQNQ
ncbi:metal ABC transporter substrate-binding protein [Patescibacteria group bacterium]|nr:metal ABC transporter substrate-binding protein [Patescibacteria group bacterium]MBU1029437.1 metal ABC transporter substrate-binding protein [Patescibacteria group bacterium]MBU1916261.1 metal ABC transporter substrate-binding protein [Patescibacteria group bacterium]